MVVEEQMAFTSALCLNSEEFLWRIGTHKRLVYDILNGDFTIKNV